MRQTFHNSNSASKGNTKRKIVKGKQEMDKFDSILKDAIGTFA